MKRILFIVIIFAIQFLTGCSNKKELYQTGINELENGNYEKAIGYFIEYQKTYGDILPLKNAYCQYAESLYADNDYISSLYYYRLSEELDPGTSDGIMNVVDVIYECGLQFLENNENLLAFQYLSYIKNDIEMDNSIIPESPLEGIWEFENNYIKLTKSTLSYMSTNQVPVSSDFSEEYILILGDFYINDEGDIEIDDHYLTHHNKQYINVIRVIDNDTIFIQGDTTLTGEYKRIK